MGNYLGQYFLDQSADNQKVFLRPLRTDLKRNKLMPGIHLLGQSHVLQFVSWILEQQQIMTVQAYAATSLPLLKQILHNINLAEISMMRTTSKEVHNSLVFTSVNHLIIKHDQILFFHIKKKSCSKAVGIHLINSMCGMATSISVYAGCHCE